MRSQNPIALLFAAACLAHPLGGSRSMAQDANAPAAPAQTQPPKTPERSSRRYTRVMEMYDPGIRFQSHTRRDKAVEHAPDTSIGESLPQLDMETPRVPAEEPQRKPKSDTEERSLWLDILYDREDEDSTNRSSSVDAKLRELWGAESQQRDAATPSGFLDPYQQMLESYRDMFAEEDRKMSGRLEEPKRPTDPFEPPPLSGEAEDELGPAFSSLMQEATRGLSDAPLAIDGRSGEDRARPTVSASTTDLIEDRKAEDAWSPERWRTMFQSAPAAEPDVAAANPAATSDDPRLPFTLPNADDSTHDFAGLTAIRKRLLISGAGESAPAMGGLAPTTVGPGFRAAPTGQEGYDYMPATGEEESSFADSRFGRTRIGSSLGGPGGGDSPLAPLTEQPQEAWGALSSPNLTEAERARPGIDESDRFRSRERQVLYDPRRGSDPFGQRDAFGRKSEWGSFGGP